jgi:hypothetical protein
MWPTKGNGDPSSKHTARMMSNDVHDQVSESDISYNIASHRLISLLTVKDRYRKVAQ